MLLLVNHVGYELKEMAKCLQFEEKETKV